MQAYDLACLCHRLCRIKLVLERPDDLLYVIYKAIRYASYKKIDEDGERHIKEILYRMESLFREIDDYTIETRRHQNVVYYLLIEIKDKEEGEYTRLIGKSFMSRIVSEMEVMTKELIPYSKTELSLIKRESMIGKEFYNKKEELIKLLLDTKSDPRIIIQGKPGSGKSTLVWDALHDYRIQNRFQIFDEEEQEFYRRSDQSAESKKYLAVFHDRSNLKQVNRLLADDESTLYKFDDLFEYNKKGTKVVIISSRDHEHIHIRASKLSLPSLDEDESWSLFQKAAFIDSQSPLFTIGRKIFLKCEKIPGVIHIVASILSSKSTTEEWEHFLNVVMTSVSDPNTTISSMIEFTKRLSKDKKIWGHCFAWCSLLPKDYKFRKDHLFHLWRAQEDFEIPYDDEVASITEEQLEYCFDEFLRRGYIHESDTNGYIASYKINYLVFELMKYVAGDEFCLVDKATPEPNHKIIRHVSFIVDPSWEPPVWLLQAKQLQSLLLWHRSSNELIPLPKIKMTLARMPQLRMLYVEVKYYDLRAYLAKLKRLKCLGLLISSISLPKDIPALQKLVHTIEIPYVRTKRLEIDGSKELKWGDEPNVTEGGVWHAIKITHSLKLTSNIPEWTSLPRNHQSFMTLQQLALSWLVDLIVLPEWIGQLTQLRQLIIHYCPRLTMLPKSEGSFSALEQLEIQYCPRVSRFPESLPSLKRLQVQEFGRLEQILRVSPTLEELEINNCDELKGEVAVNVWESLNCLHYLKLINMDTYPKGLEFAKLSKLSRLDIEKSPKLTYLPESLCSLSILVHLRIHYYPGMMNLPDNLKKLSSLTKLDIRVTPQLEKRCKPGGEDWSVIQHISEIVMNDTLQQSGAEQQINVA